MTNSRSIRILKIQQDRRSLIHPKNAARGSKLQPHGKQIHSAQEPQIRIETQDPSTGQARHPLKPVAKSRCHILAAASQHIAQLNEARSRPFSSRTGGKWNREAQGRIGVFRVWDPDLLLLGDLLLELARLLPQRLHLSPSSLSLRSRSDTHAQTAVEATRTAAPAPTRCRSKRSRPSIRRF
jgi:hypothetical protein